MVAFAGYELPEQTATALRARPYAGLTLFRHWNVQSPAQLRALTAAIQAAASAGARPLLIATDQEGGQLNALGDGPTEFAGAMALGAVGDDELAQRVGAATARELLALGVNVDYAPVCDLASNPENPALGIRCFGDEPVAVGRLAAATVRGLQSAGVAATVKHFPGLGNAPADTHHGPAAVASSRAELEERELVPFRAAIAAGARLAMAGHLAVPALTGDDTLPASLSERVLRGVLRDDIGFQGLTITDALDMAAVASGAGVADPVLAAVSAGEDLLLGTPLVPLLDALPDDVGDAAPGRRLAALRRWLASFDQPPLEMVGCAEHQALALELARRSVTLVRDDDGLLPLRPAPDGRVLVVQPQPADLTPADTSSTVTPTLADSIRRRHARTDELITAAEPAEADLAAVRSRATEYDAIIVGSVAAHLQPAQAALVRAVLDTGRPTITVALRTPWDLLAYPGARTHVCTYGALAPSMEMLAAALFGQRGFEGHLPVRLGQLYPRGHGLRSGQAVGA